MTWVAAMIAMCCPWIVVVYGVNACAAFCPMPRIVYPVWALVARAVCSPGRPAILAVVVGLGDERHAGALERVDDGGRRVEDELLALRVGAGAVGQGGLVVDHGQVGAREQLRHRGTESVGGVGRQPVPQGGAGREVDVAPEGEGHGLPVTLPVRVEPRIAGARWRRPVRMPGAAVVLARRGGVAAAARGEKGDEQGEEHEPAQPDEPVALDPTRGQCGQLGRRTPRRVRLGRRRDQQVGG